MCETSPLPVHASRNVIHRRSAISGHVSTSPTATKRAAEKQPIRSRRSSAETSVFDSASAIACVSVAEVCDAAVRPDSSAALAACRAESAAVPPLARALRATVAAAETDAPTVGQMTRLISSYTSTMSCVRPSAVDRFSTSRIAMPTGPYATKDRTIPRPFGAFFTSSGAGAGSRERTRISPMAGARPTGCASLPSGSRASHAPRNLPSQYQIV